LTLEHTPMDCLWAVGATVLAVVVPAAVLVEVVAQGAETAGLLRPEAVPTGNAGLRESTRAQEEGLVSDWYLVTVGGPWIAPSSFSAQIRFQQPHLAHCIFHRRKCR
jgi:hypothetical protein